MERYQIVKIGANVGWGRLKLVELKEELWASEDGSWEVLDKKTGKRMSVEAALAIIQEMEAADAVNPTWGPEFR